MNTSFRVNDEVEIVELGCLDWEDIAWLEEAGLEVGDRFIINSIGFSKTNEHLSLVGDTSEFHYSPLHFKLVEKLSCEA